MKHCIDKLNYKIRVSEAVKIMKERGVQEGIHGLVTTIFGFTLQEIAEMITWYKKKGYDHFITDKIDKKKVRDVIDEEIANNHDIEAHTVLMHLKEQLELK